MKLVLAWGSYAFAFFLFSVSPRLAYAISRSDGLSEAQFFKTLSNTFDSAEKIEKGFFKIQDTKLVGECISLSFDRRGKPKRYFHVADARFQAIYRRNLGGKILYIGQTGSDNYEPDFDHLEGPSYQDENDDLSQKNFSVTGGFEGSSDYFNHFGKATLRAATYQNRPVLIYYHENKIYAQSLPNQRDDDPRLFKSSTTEVCYFE